MIINTKKILPLLLLLLGTLSLTPVNAADIPSSMEYQGSKLVLNGSGSRIKLFMKVYENSLYLLSSSSNDEEIINNDEVMAIRIDVTSSLVTTDAMKKAILRG